MRTHAQWLGIGIAAGLMLFLAQATRPTPALAGPYAGPPYLAGDMVAWATSVASFDRGPVDIADPTGPLASVGTASDALGAQDSSVVSLGDAGSITVTFDDVIGDGAGDDFAVFENGFLATGSGEIFAELAHVEVSSDGIQFVRFASITLDAPPPDERGGFSTLDPTDIDNFAGDQPAPFGTGFDLGELSAHPLVLDGQVDLSAISHVRLVDVIGDGSTEDSLMQPIYEPYPTPFPSGGFDLDAVGVIHVPEPSTGAGLLAGLGLLLGLRRRRTGLAALATLAFMTTAMATPASAIFVDFEDQGLVVGEFDNGSGGEGGFVSGGQTFENTFTDTGTFTFWSGFSSSAVRDVTTAGFGNQYAAYKLDGIPGSGADDSVGYGVYFQGSERLVLSEAAVIESAFITNTTYAGLSMLNGDAFAKKFGGETGDDPDFFTVSFIGYDALDEITGTAEFFLADYRFADNSLDYIIDEWTEFDLSGLGTVSSVGFAFAGSDIGDFGLNTPAYFAIDNISIVPEPSTALLVGLGLLGLARRSRTA